MVRVVERCNLLIRNMEQVATDPVGASCRKVREGSRERNVAAASKVTVKYPV